MSEVISMIYTSVSNFDQAKILAKKVVENKLAACVNIFPQGVSVYSWEDSVKMEEEIYMIFKTSVAKENMLENFLDQNHPYETPAILRFHPNSNDDYYKFLMNTLANVS